MTWHWFSNARFGRFYITGNKIADHIVKQAIYFDLMDYNCYWDGSLYYETLGTCCMTV